VTAARKSATGPSKPADNTAGPVGPKRRRVSEKRERVNDALRLELHALRAELARIVEGIEVRLGGRIADMLRTLEGDDSIDQPPRHLSTAQAQAALDEIDGIGLDKGKPRLRDLRRIQQLVRRLRDRIPE
jgi:hypothetical protein